MRSERVTRSPLIPKVKYLYASAPAAPATAAAAAAAADDDDDADEDDDDNDDDDGLNPLLPTLSLKLLLSSTLSFKLAEGPLVERQLLWELQP